MIANSIVWGSTNLDRDAVPATNQLYTSADTLRLEHDCVQYYYGANPTILSLHPRFLDPNGDDNVLGTTDDDLRVEDSSPVINAGDADLLPPGVVTDIAGNPRVRGGVVDLGAWENQTIPDPGTVTGMELREEPGVVRCLVSLEDVLPGCRLTLFRGDSPEAAARTAIASVELEPSAIRWEGVDAGATGETSWYWVELTGPNRGRVGFGPLSARSVGVLTRPALGPARPNPFLESTSMEVVLPEDAPAARARLTVFDVNGRLVLAREFAATPGRNVISWDGRDGAGRPGVGGVYYLQMAIGAWRASKKVVLVR